MSDDQDTKVDTKAIWLTILRGGGKWTVREVATELCSDADSIHRLIAMMSQRGYVRRYAETGKTLQFSVDRNCKIPLGVHMGELMDAGAV